MSDENKRNLQYFESSSMKELFDLMNTWQIENEKRLLSLSIEKDESRFCCIALTNPTEVVIKDGYEYGSGVAVKYGALKVTSD